MTTSVRTLRPGQILTGPLFNEPMRVETVQPNGPTSWVVGLVGTQSERFRKVTLSADEIDRLTILEAQHSFAGDGRLLRLGLQAYALGIAYEFDPYFGLSISRVDPLPHQLEAIYDYLLKLARVRFLLADDAGAGKTVMAGLLIRELELRGLAERILIVCPANLAFQWQRELKEKFDGKFLVLKGQDIREQFGVNQWLERNRLITSLDLAKRQDILPGLRQVRWDLVIVDEAHRMSTADESHKSMRYRLGELLRDISDHILLLTATPHKGDPQNFSLFLQLLDADAYADVRSIREAMDRRRAPFYLRRTKEAMVYFPQRREDGTWAAAPIFTKRIPQRLEQVGVVTHSDRSLRNEVHDHLKRLAMVREYKFPVEIVREGDLETVTEIFIRVNSAGTRLREAELALARLAWKLPGSIVGPFEQLEDACLERGFNLDARFFMRALISVATRQSRFRDLKGFWERPAAEIERVWRRTMLAHERSSWRASIR